MTLLHHRKRHVHVAVIHSTEMVTNCRIGSWSIRRKRDVFALARLDGFVNLELSHEEAMRHVRALQTKDDRLTFLQSDLVGSKSKTLSGDLDYARAVSF